jgi:hypothetical protein
MKKTLCLLCFLYLVACNTAEKKSEETSTASAAPVAEEKVDLPYKIENPDNWEHGSLKNVEIAMNALKAMENNDIPGSMQYFADSIHFAGDGFEGRFSKDSMQSMMTHDMANLKSIKFEMNDWETVVSHDKQQEYVSLWYKQTTVGNDGKVDSVICMDDIRLKDGKIVEIEEKVRHYPKK